jgi:hypothetical protein
MPNMYLHIDIFLTLRLKKEDATVFYIYLEIIN